MKPIRLLVIAMLSAGLAACSSPRAFTKSTTSLDVREKSVVLLAIELPNSDLSGGDLQPLLANVSTSTPGDVLHYEFNRRIDGVEQDGKTICLVRMAMPPGSYKLRDVYGLVMRQGTFSIPLNLAFQVKPGSVTYAGHLSASLRKRAGNEFRAGSLSGLQVYQASDNISEVTWDAHVEDQASRDIGLFRATYPVLKDMPINTGVLPPFDREAAQRLADGKAD